MGGDGEHDSRAGSVLDRDPRSVWDTETYLAGNLAKAGVGIAIDAKPRVDARQIRIDTPTPGWSGSVYAAAGGNAPPATIDDPAWKKVGAIPLAERRTRVDLDTAGNAFRWYLVWIEKFAPDQEKVEISEVYLYR